MPTTHSAFANKAADDDCAARVRVSCARTLQSGLLDAYKHHAPHPLIKFESMGGSTNCMLMSGGQMATTAIVREQAGHTQHVQAHESKWFMSQDVKHLQLQQPPPALSCALAALPQQPEELEC